MRHVESRCSLCRKVCVAFSNFRYVAFRCDQDHRNWQWWVDTGENDEQ